MALINAHNLSSIVSPALERWTTRLEGEHAGVLRDYPEENGVQSSTCILPRQLEHWQSNWTSGVVGSMTHAVFRGLQAELKDTIANLPVEINLSLRRGLIDVHWKLILDPCTLYERLYKDYKSEPELHTHLKKDNAPSGFDAEVDEYFRIISQVEPWVVDPLECWYDSVHKRAPFLMPESRRKPVKSDGIHRSWLSMESGIFQWPPPTYRCSAPVATSAHITGTLWTSRHHRHIDLRVSRGPATILPSSRAALFPAGCALSPPHPPPSSSSLIAPSRASSARSSRLPHEDPPGITGKPTGGKWSSEESI
ncbi:hypothetical protein DFH08DRAFT_813060 [Mycena albidolilacea]|uniref:Uncharacterized protein n=1 Tax=Mycena albidolilacea TaxID=1033008 RepID=A0AAD6ZS34_9AGAR|nr:hypothetical protein DFH08DRAFT_813060 [Mycena albidolilacea]